jgi:hypothetical protein
MSDKQARATRFGQYVEQLRMCKAALNSILDRCHGSETTN